MASARKKQDDINLETLRELVSENGNKYCLDCNQRGPTYVNTTIGSFVCSKCSGMLRGLTPPHRVKSISMATFTPEEIEFIKSRGNDYCRRVWLGLYDGKDFNSLEEQSIKDFMSDKYEKKRYFMDVPKEDTVVPNGISTKIRKAKSKSAESTAASLISISPPVATKPKSDAGNISHKIISNLFPINVNKVGQQEKSVQPLGNLIPEQFPTPDFPVDFSTADIYNSNQCYDNFNNNLTSQTSGVFTQSTPVSENDRYAALADLDMALRQENLKNLVTNCNSNATNPFQSSQGNDVLSKNPFYNGVWSSGAMTSNPFMPSSTSNGNVPSSKNPFL